MAQRGRLTEIGWLGEGLSEKVMFRLKDARQDV